MSLKSSEPAHSLLALIHQGFLSRDISDEIPCGGTHCKSTGEIGFVTLKRVNIGGSKERIEIRLVDDFMNSSPYTSREATEQDA